MQDFKDDSDMVKVIRKRKMKRNLIKCGFALPPLTYLSLLGLAFAKILPFSQVFSSTALVFCPFNISNVYSDDVRKETNKVLDGISNDISEAIGDSLWKVRDLEDITIIPKNIQVGEDLEAINIVPIFKEGKYIIIRGNSSLQILAQYEEDGKNVVKILDENEVSDEYNSFDDKTKKKIERKNKILSFILKD